MKKLNSVEIRDAREQLKLKAHSIISTCKEEIRDLTDEEEKALEEIRSQIKEKDAELDELKTRLESLTFADENEERSEENNNITNKSKQSMEKRFSILKAIRSIVNNQPLDDVTLAVVKEGQEEARKAGINTAGQLTLPEERATVTVAAEGGDVVATELFSIWGPLRAKNVLISAGSVVYDGLVGNVQIPTMSKGQVTWEGETASASDGAPSFDHVTLSPKRLTAYVDISKQMLVQDSIGVEQAIRNEMINAINAKLEETLLGSAAGSATQPEGIFNAITPTAVATFADVCDKESDVEDANVNGECVYVLSNKAKAGFRAMSKGTKSTQLVYENKEVDGTKAYNTSNIAGKNYIYGDFSNLVIGNWGGVDVTVDPFTKAADGQIRIVLNMFVDAKIVRPTAFTTGTIQ